MHSQKKNGGNSLRGSATGCQNVFCFFVIKATRPFGHLSGTDFDHFWNNRRESLSACVHWWKIFQFLRRGFAGSQNSPKYGTLGCGVCDRAAAQTAQLWAMGIILGASRHPKMCLLYSSFGGGLRFGRYKPTKKPKFWRLHYLSWPNRITVGVNSNRNRLPL